MWAMSLLWCNRNKPWFIQSLIHVHDSVCAPLESVSALTRRICSATLQWRGPARTAPGSTPRIWLCARGPTSSAPPPGWTFRWWPPSGPCCWWPGSRAATAWRWRAATRSIKKLRAEEIRGVIDCFFSAPAVSPLRLELALLLRRDGAAGQTTLSQLRGRVPEGVHRSRLFVIDEDLAVLLGGVEGENTLLTWASLRGQTRPSSPPVVETLSKRVDSQEEIRWSL